MLKSNMRIINCTQKLLKELKVTAPLPAPDILPAKGLGNWYANLLRLDRRKCVMFTNEISMYSFLIPNVKKENLINLHEEFLKHLTKNLQFEEFSGELTSKVHEEYLQIAYARTASRKVLGFMNDFAFQYEFVIYRAGGVGKLSLLEENAQINRTPCNASSTKNCFRPIEVMRKMILERM